MTTTARQLRERIHRLFVQEDHGSDAAEAYPEFWDVPTTETAEVHEPRTVYNTMREQAVEDAAVAEQHWLCTPNPTFGGRSPNDMIGGADCDRDKLDAAIAAIEQGAFT